MAASIPVLLFHAIEDKKSVISSSPAIFRAGMQRLRRSGYRTLPLSRATEYIRSGTAFPERAFVLTFDDGFQTVYTHAFPVLNEYGMSATVFLSVGAIAFSTPGREPLPSHGGRTMMNWGQIREMQKWGMSFGAHTVTHPDLTRISETEAQAEMRDSQAVIEDRLGVPVDCFAYPYGRFNKRIRAIALRHFSSACGVELNLMSLKSDLYALERVDAWYLRSGRFFSLMTTPLFHWYVRSRNIPRLIRRTLNGRAG